VIKLIHRPTKELSDTMGRSGTPNNTLPKLLPGPSHGPPAHQRPISTSPEEHRHTLMQAGTQTEDSQETPCLGPFQGCPSRVSACLTRCETQHHESIEQLWRSPSRLRGLLPRGCIVQHSKKAVQDHRQDLLWDV